MSWLRARDYSVYQGDIDFAQEPIDISLIKMSGGDNGLYLDPKAAQNYERSLAAGKPVGGYHFAGGTDPTQEAAYFLRAMSPLAENDVYILDFEVGVTDPVGWVLTFVDFIHTQINVWPIVYMSGSRWNQYDWSAVTANCGVWVAWWGISPDADVPVKYPYIIHQYDNSGTVVSNGSRVDEDAVFLTIEEFQAYGYHAQVTQPTPPVDPTPAEPTPPPTPVEPAPTPTEPTTPEPVPDPTTPAPDPSPPIDTPAQSWVRRFVAWLLAIFGIKLK